MSWMTYIGLAAATITTISHTPQVIKSWKTKKTKDVSLLMYIALATGVFLWLLYGVLIKDLPLILANSITFIFTFSTLVLKIKYG
ncbi:MAG: SemiSWEET transporter [Nanoarchaeota archaeon]|nr:SemiSWEET transporter [Nanoarchaeota archaeon]MBU1052046.1 SemiSWEET transporter [Nanoarchaeota archaeon]MBU1988817.1 SemiSWEET transporter [Nanoarchaeota archaeon]